VSQAKSHFSKIPTRKFQIDIIINNAGISGIIPIPKIEVSDIQRMYAVNVQGPLLLIQAAKPYLPTDRRGRIVNISSISATFGFVGQSIYAGTKAALDAMTRNWSRELAENATVNSVNPGPVNTEMYRLAGPEFHNMIKPFIQIAPLAAAREDLHGFEAVENAKESGGRAADVTEIAAIVSMICSQESRWCTGSMISANGGMIFSL
jgi:NAD(P)-dependent dehydrogenase (short-subunit alcohol dehydrogenase family)